MRDHSIDNPRSSASVYAPTDLREERARHAIAGQRRRALLARIGWIAAWIAGGAFLAYAFLMPEPTQPKQTSAVPADATSLYLGANGPARIDREIRSMIRYQDGMLYVGPDGTPETAVTANTPWGVECDGEGLKVHVAMATEASVEDGGNGFYLSTTPFQPEQCKSILPVMIATMKAVVAGR